MALTDGLDQIVKQIINEASQALTIKAIALSLKRRGGTDDGLADCLIRLHRWGEVRRLSVDAGGATPFYAYCGQSVMTRLTEGLYQSETVAKAPEIAFRAVPVIDTADALAAHIEGAGNTGTVVELHPDLVAELSHKLKAPEPPPVSVHQDSGKDRPSNNVTFKVIGPDSKKIAESVRQATQAAVHQMRESLVRSGVLPPADGSIVEPEGDAKPARVGELLGLVSTLAATPHARRILATDVIDAWRLDYHLGAALIEIYAARQLKAPDARKNAAKRASGHLANYAKARG